MPWETLSNFWEEKLKMTAQVSDKIETRTQQSQLPMPVIAPAKYTVTFWFSFKGEVLD